MNNDTDTSPKETYQQKKWNQNRWVIFTIAVAVFSSGIGSGYLLRGVNTTRSNIEKQANFVLTKARVNKLITQVNPSQGYELQASFGTIGPQLLKAGAINLKKFKAIYLRAKQPLTSLQMDILTKASSRHVVFNKKNAYFLLNFFWALGLTNQSKILVDGPMMQQGPQQLGRFASTGGWTIGSRPSTELFSSIPILRLSPAQEALLARVSKTVYRPCCNNPTSFPDCNHGMAMLGLLTLMASQGASEQELYQAAKYANAYWFPEQTVELAIYFQATKGLDFANIDASTLVGGRFLSASGFQSVHRFLTTRQILSPRSNSGSSCGV